jgi:hypothetical protein
MRGSWILYGSFVMVLMGLMGTIVGGVWGMIWLVRWLLDATGWREPTCA